MPAAYTIGHSTHPIEHFLALLNTHQIAAIADVRSAPFSRRHPQFTRSNLERSLHTAGIAYHFFGRELGARSEDPSCYVNGKVQYERIAETALFQQGLARLIALLPGATPLAILCAEKDPLQCHRTILVARHLNGVVHIHADASLETHPHLMQRLITQLRLPPEDMFRTAADVLDDAYRIQGNRIAYTRTTANGDIMNP
ncbi:MAG: DUF488 domain-containing protein [Acidobacteria bacterium]|nr:DUF488 domain-containing protein [Acidobacteriota bacterium]